MPSFMGASALGLWEPRQRIWRTFRRAENRELYVDLNQSLLQACSKAVAGRARVAIEVAEHHHLGRRAVSSRKANGSPSRVSESAAATHHVEKVMVIFRRLHFVKNEFHRLNLIHWIQQLAQNPTFLKDFRLE